MPYIQGLVFTFFRFILCIWMLCLYACMCTFECAWCLLPLRPTGKWNHLELELQRAVSYYVGTGNGTWSLCKSNKCTSSLSLLSSPRCSIKNKTKESFCKPRTKVSMGNRERQRIAKVRKTQLQRRKVKGETAIPLDACINPSSVAI